jgi:hypothetical protein
LKTPFTRTLQTLLASLLFLTPATPARTAPAPEEKMKAEDVVAKHLASVGSAADLAAVKSLVAVGNVRAATRLNTPRVIPGVGQFASEGDKVLFALALNSTDYPYEKAGYDGQRLTVAQLPEGRRSTLGDFLKGHDAPFKQGLVGGVISTAWPLFNAGPEMPKLSYAGTDKIDERKVHKLRYDPRRSGGLEITLFFDGETFRHVRTEYRYSVAAGMGATAELSVRQLESHYKLVEEFSDFKAAGKLTLPHTYKLTCTIEEQNNTRVLQWTVAFSQFAFNQQIDVKAFSFSNAS